jgi:alpha-tubulin suppressor-like RCC1 family protein
MKTRLLLLLSLFTLQINAQCWNKIASGLYHTVAVSQDGTLWTWGASTYTNVNSSIPIKIGNDTDWVTVGSGYHHSFAIKSNGTLWAWGYNYYGQLGNGAFGNTANISVPTQIGTDTNWRSVTGGELHTLATKTDGTLWSTGKNGVGELGFNDFADRHVFTQVNTDTDWGKIACGRSHSIALKTAGQLNVWGGNGSGQLGLYSTTNRKTPGWIMQTMSFTDIAGGLSSTIAIKSDGTMWRAGYGCVIPGSVWNFTEFVNTPANWNSVKIGNNFIMATKNDGSIWALGTNDYGQFGNPSFNSSTSFVRPNMDVDWSTNISVNNFGTLILKNNGQLYGTGQNVDGELGLGDLVNKSVFTAMTCPFTLGTNDFSQNNLKVSLYPNPASNVLNIEMDTELKLVEVYNLQGQKVKSSSSRNIHVSDLSSGIYMVRVEDENGSISIQKLIKE